ncbi:HAD family hydrolase [Streptomyces sp. TLI_185]|uniref:HAD family hydrolase n=1 Tax=Streptomyces sp. TLI_185 TaxID=2485151 RepID=UPI000F4F11AF|nr:HAD family hydrolase [Streptomyces sp. TLI_185]RPF34524.1 phosphoglycolate phosphatase-like HAD superfamily hydrolase [Streptomyces sp. TLI_185]
MADTIDDQEALLHLLARTSAVLFDFDGPVCRLFPKSTAGIARKIKRTAEEVWGPLDRDVRACDDSHHILRPLWRMYERLYEEQAPERRPSRRPLEFAEKTVAEAESAAAANAVPTEHFGELVAHLRRLHLRLVVVSNNAEGAILRCLDGMGMAPEFEAVFGRDPHDARLMKPDPHCVLRALAHLGTPAPACLLVGDQLTDLTAARTAGTRFLGWTQDEIQAKEMERDGSDAVVSSHLPLTAAARRLFEAGHSAESVSDRAVPTRT